MTAADVVVAVIAAIAGVLIAPRAQRLIESVPPDPDDDPPPVPRAAPWLGRSPRLAVLLALVAGTVALRSGAEAATVAHVVAALGLTVLSVIDLDLFLLPKRIVWPLVGATAALLAVAAVVEGTTSPFTRALVGGAAAFGAFFVLHFISPNGMGFGDVRLAALIGLDLGWIGSVQIVAGLFGAFVVAAVVGLSLMAAGKRSRQDAVPFGPFMALGCVFVLVGGDALLGLARV